MAKRRPLKLPELSALELNRIAGLPECEHFSSVSEDTMRRVHPDKIVRISPRRVGMRVGDALNLPLQTAARLRMLGANARRRPYSNCRQNEGGSRPLARFTERPA